LLEHLRRKETTLENDLSKLQAFFSKAKVPEEMKTIIERSIRERRALSDADIDAIRNLVDKIRNPKLKYYAQLLVLKHERLKQTKESLETFWNAKENNIKLSKKFADGVFELEKAEKAMDATAKEIKNMALTNRPRLPIIKKLINFITSDITAIDPTAMRKRLEELKQVYKPETWKRAEKLVKESENVQKKIQAWASENQRMRRIVARELRRRQTAARQTT